MKKHLDQFPPVFNRPKEGLDRNSSLFVFQTMGETQVLSFVSHRNEVKMVPQSEIPS